MICDECIGLKDLVEDYKKEILQLESTTINLDSEIKNLRTLLRDCEVEISHLEQSLDTERGVNLDLQEEICRLRGWTPLCIDKMKIPTSWLQKNLHCGYKVIDGVLWVEDAEKLTLVKLTWR
jgi:predicted nuclease with TOPRIM domain